MAAVLERHQVIIYVAALAVGATVGLAAPGLGPGLEHIINPVLAALLYVTFLQVPAADLLRAARSGRFLAAALTVNFVAVPIVVAALFPLLPDDQAVRVGVLLVLLAPCVDYVIVFSGLAGGSSEKLQAATPILLIAQMLLLPVFLVLFMGSDLVDVVETEPFLEAFLILIAGPLLLAWLTQAWAARQRSGRGFADGCAVAMVPLMVATLFTVVASQIPKLDDNFDDVAQVLPLYVAFLVVMAGVGVMVARSFGLDAAGGRAIVFSGATRNSLVVLPLALALPEPFAIAAVVIVAQTLIEVLGMVVYVRIVPLVLAHRDTEPHVAGD